MKDIYNKTDSHIKKTNDPNVIIYDFSHDNKYEKIYRFIYILILLILFTIFIVLGEFNNIK